MKIVEQFTASKTGDDFFNEDAVVVTDNFVAVLDGVTSKTGTELRGVSTGRFAAQTIAAEISKLPADITAPVAIEHLRQHLKAAVETAAAQEGVDFGGKIALPAAAFLCYARQRQEVWRLADSFFTLDGKLFEKALPQEAVWSALRSYYITAMKVKGMTEEEYAAQDPFSSVLQRVIGEAGVFANHDSDPYGYGVLNGDKVPARHIEVFSTQGVKELIMASDGYVKIFPTLAETESYLQEVLAEDPLMYRRYPQTKGLKKGRVSFDDRSYIRLDLT